MGVIAICVQIFCGASAVLLGTAIWSCLREYRGAVKWNRGRALIGLAAKRNRDLWLSATRAGRVSGQLTDADLSKALRDIKAGAVVMAREEGLDIVAALGGPSSFEALAWGEVVKLA